MTDLDAKINSVFLGTVVRKDLAREIRGNAIVPTYVLEYLLGQYCTTNDEATIQSGIETVKQILAKHYVHRNEAELVRSNIKERGRQKVIDKISVSLNTKKDAYEAAFANLGIKQLIVDSDTVKKHPKLLVSGIWCIADVSYAYTEDREASPWILNAIKPIQLSYFDMENYLQGRAQFTTEEWVDFLIQSIGFDPEKFSRRSKLTQLLRLVPFCERNYNLMELGPKGTGKSHIYSEFSPHGILISGGEVTVPKLFVNNGNGKIGLVGYWDCVAFDEFAGKQKRVDKALVDIMKNYMANKTFSRGVETLGAEASMVFVGNTQHTVPHMLKTADLFTDLPDKYHDTAFLDRVHFYIPGWEVDIIRGDMFSKGYGFVVDYLAEILRSLRDHDFSNKYQSYFTLGPGISTRDRDGIHKTFSGLMKILYPSGEASESEIQELLSFAVEGRKRVKDQLLRIDKTFKAVDFVFTGKRSGKEYRVTTLEEREYPNLYYLGTQPEEVQDVPEQADTFHGVETNGAMMADFCFSHAQPSQDLTGESELIPEVKAAESFSKKEPQEGHFTYMENQRGVSFEKLFGDYLTEATSITVQDPYIRLFHQQRNFMDLLELIVRKSWPDREVKVHLLTIQDELKAELQEANFVKMQASCERFGVHLTWEYDETQTIHARYIETDTGWKISLDRGLDIYQSFDNDVFSFGTRMPEFRACKPFEVTYIRTKTPF